MTADYFPPVNEEDEDVVLPNFAPEEAVVVAPEVVGSPLPESTLAPVEAPEPVAVVAPAAGLTQVQAAASAQDPTTPSPFKPTPGVCGWCGNADSVEPQSHYAFCYKCGHWSDPSGNPIQGNPHARANMSETFAWANAL